MENNIKMHLCYIENCSELAEANIHLWNSALHEIKFRVYY